MGRDAREESAEYVVSDCVSIRSSSSVSFGIGGGLRNCDATVSDRDGAYLLTESGI